MDLFEESVLRAIQGLNLSAPSGSATDPETTEVIETVGPAPEKPSPSAPILVSGVTPKNILHHPDAHPIALDLLMLKRYGIEWLEWDAETVEMRVPVDFKTTLSEVNAHKINAVKSLHLVDSFWQQWEVFVWCTMSFNGLIPNFEVMQVPSVAQCLVSIDVANRVRTDTPFSDEIKRFLEAVYRHDGIFCPQPPADFVHLDTTNLLVDCEEVSKLWPDVKASGKAPSEESITAEQLRRLLIVNGYLEESRDHLRQQIKVVQNV